jgi:hypothetical protein
MYDSRPHQGLAYLSFGSRCTVPRHKYSRNRVTTQPEQQRITTASVLWVLLNGTANFNHILQAYGRYIHSTRALSAHKGLPLGHMQKQKSAVLE